MNSQEGVRISGTACLKCTEVLYQEVVIGCNGLFDFQGNSVRRMHFQNVAKMLLILPKVVRYLEHSIRGPKKVLSFVRFIVGATDVGTGTGRWGTCPQDFAVNEEVPLCLFVENTPFLLKKKWI